MLVLVRVRADGEARQVRVRDLRRVEDDARVEGDDPLRRGQQRVDVDLGDARLLRDELAEPDEERGEHVLVDGLAAADALERVGDRRLPDELPGERRVERRQGQGAVLEDLDQLAAHAEQQDRAELRIGAAAHDQLVAGPVDHRLDRDALEVLGADLLGDGVPDLGEGLADGIRGAQVEDHAADVGLVGDRPRQQLGDDRVAHGVGRGDRLVLGLGELGVGDRDAVGGEDLLALVLGEQGAALGADVRDDPVDLLAELAALRRDRQARRLVQRAEVVVVAPQVVEQDAGGVRVGEGRDAGLAQDLRALGDVLAAHPGGEDGLAVDLRVLDEGPRGRRRVRHRLRREDRRAGRRSRGPPRRSRAPWRSGPAARRR